MWRATRWWQHYESSTQHCQRPLYSRCLKAPIMSWTQQEGQRHTHFCSCSCVAACRHAAVNKTCIVQTVAALLCSHMWQPLSPLTCLQSVDVSSPDLNCVCVSAVNQRVFQQGAEAALPRSQQHRRLHIHVERHHDHGDALIFQLSLSHLVITPVCQRPPPSVSQCYNKLFPPAVCLCTVRLLWRERPRGLRGEPLQAPQPQ